MFAFDQGNGEGSRICEPGWKMSDVGEETREKKTEEGVGQNGDKQGLYTKICTNGMLHLR